MSIEIRTYVSIDDKYMIKPNHSFTTKSGVPYPDSLSVTYTEVYTYEDKDGVLIDGERGYVIKIPGSDDRGSGKITSEVVELNNFLRSYDFKKYPLQLETEMFTPYREYNRDAGSMISKNQFLETTAKITAKELLEKLKPKK